MLLLFNLQVHAHENRGIMAWCGAQIFSQPELRDAQRGVWVSKDEYEEIGDNIFLIKVRKKIKQIEYTKRYLLA